MPNTNYSSHGLIIHPHLQSVERDGQLTPVRPKTFALLLHLLKHPQQVISKQELLDAVWDDVKVEEQVLVQSIRELRQIFGDAEVIQTYPRKGYAWAAAVEVIAEAEEASLPKLRRTAKALFISIAVMGLMIVAALWYQPATNPQPAVLIMLPVKNQAQGKDHRWVPLGAMDQVIQSLVSTPQVQVMDTDYVLNLLRQAGIPREPSPEQIARIFAVSGATLVVESELSGSVGEFRLAYRLHFADHSKRGVLFAESAEALVRELTAVVTANLNLGVQQAAKSSRAGFGNELMAQALESQANEQWDAARALFESLKHLEPDNLGARQSLVNILLQQQEYDLALREIEAVLAQADTAAAKQAGHFYYLLALTHTKRNDLVAALAALNQADTLAKRDSDVLYQGFNAQLRGSILQQQQAFGPAQESYTQALASHRLLRCSIGMTLTRLQMVELYIAQGDAQLAREHYTEAKRLIDEHGLTALQKDLAQVSALLP